MIDFFDFKPIYPLNIVDLMSQEEIPPICVDNDHLILLNTSGSRYFLQNVYQLAHELCHYIIREKSEQNCNSWLEESICELSSIFFLNRLKHAWSIDSNYFKHGYSSAFEKYVLDVSDTQVPFDLTDLRSPTSEIYSKMNSDEYLRGLNAYVAFELLPFFESNPSIWKDIHLIIHYDPTDLKDLFATWERNALPINKEAISSMSQLFLH